MIDITRSSSLKKLIIVTGYVITFVNNLKGTLKNDNANILLESTLTIDEYNNALNLYIKMEQGILQRQADFGKLKVSLKLFVDTLEFLHVLENSFFTKL